MLNARCEPPLPPLQSSYTTSFHRVGCLDYCLLWWVGLNKHSSFCKLPTAVASALLHTSGGQLLVQPGTQDGRAAGGLLRCGVATQKKLNI